MDSLPLAGVRVSEHTDTLAGRYAGFLLAELGAECVLVAPTPAARPVWSRVLDRRKRWQRSAGAADVVLSDRDHAESRESGAIVCRIAGWGTPGPRTGAAWSEALVQALSGIQTFQWSWSGHPVWLVTPVVSYMTGTLAALGVAAALLARARGAGGQRVQVTALDAAFTLNAGRFVTAPGWQGSLSEQGDPLGAYPTYGVYQTRDGWLFVGALTQAFVVKLMTAVDRLALLADPRLPENPLALSDPDARRLLRAELTPIFRSRSTAAWLETLAAADVPCGAVRSRTEALEDAEARAGAHVIPVQDPDLGPTWQPGSPAEFTARPAGPARCAPTRLDRPLAGLRVLDLTSFIAGPFAPRLLADLGAEILKIEAPDGDPFRLAQFGFVGWNRGKRSVVLDLKAQSGRDAFLAIGRASDVVVDNVRVGVMDRLGLGDDVLFGARPDLVRTSITGYGDGVDAARPGFDPVFQARTGLMQAQGGGDEPVVYTMAYNDYCAGALGALATVAALVARERDGGGRRVELSLFRTGYVAQAADMLLAPGFEPGSPGGRDFLGPSPGRRLHQCSDGWLCTDARTPAEERAIRALAGGDVEAWARSRACREAEQALTEVQVASAPCLAFPQLLDDAHVRARRSFVELRDDTVGPVVLPGPAIAFERTPIVYDRGAPRLGADTDDVLRAIPG